MPKGLKPTSSQLVISFGLQESGPNTFTTERVDLQLNALDNEVFVITAVKMDIASPDYQIGAGLNRYGVFASLSKQSIEQSTSRGLDNTSVFATANAQVVVNSDGAGIMGATMLLENDTDTPTGVEYTDIIATPDFFVNINGVNQAGAVDVSGKLYGYRAVATDGATYAALVQSELLSQ